MSRILCIEDEDDLREEIVEELIASEYDVVTAIDGVDGLQAMKKYQPDLVLCDITMPNMDGRELLKIIRDMPDFVETPFIFLTALADKSEQISGMELGADEYLTKPIDFDVLIARVRSSLRQIERIRGKKQAEHVKLYKALQATLEVPDKIAEELPRLAGLDIAVVGKSSGEFDEFCSLLKLQGGTINPFNSGSQYIKQAYLQRADITFIWLHTNDIEARMLVKLLPEEVRDNSGKLALVWPANATSYSHKYAGDLFTNIIDMPCQVEKIVSNILEWVSEETAVSSDPNIGSSLPSN